MTAASGKLIKGSTGDWEVSETADTDTDKPEDDPTMIEVLNTMPGIFSRSFATRSKSFALVRA